MKYNLMPRRYNLNSLNSLNKRDVVLSKYNKRKKAHRYSRSNINRNRHRYRNMFRGCNIEYLIGGILILIGTILILKNTIVFSSIGYGRMYLGGKSFSGYLVPLLIGIVILGFNRRSKIGLIVIGLGFVLMLIGIISSLKIGFLPTSLFKTLVMFIFIFIGLTIILKKLFKR
ncbi:hypothetical protein [Clostridium sp.]|uniref:hypothetical protein n=1 Tax=Clostridium sp. TaxID=1506 RepID=UPI003F2FC5A7